MDNWNRKLILGLIALGSAFLLGCLLTGSAFLSQVRITTRCQVDRAYEILASEGPGSRKLRGFVRSPSIKRLQDIESTDGKIVSYRFVMEYVQILGTPSSAEVLVHRAGGTFREILDVDAIRPNAWVTFEGSTRQD